MRITVHLDAFDRLNPNAYAILWLDDASLKWSREGHLGLALPEWGKVCSDGKNTLICPPSGGAPQCVLEGMDIGSDGGPFEGETGPARWQTDAPPDTAAGHWHVQCIDHTCTPAEFSVFADDVAA